MHQDGFPENTAVRVHDFVETIAQVGSTGPDRDRSQGQEPILLAQPGHFRVKDHKSGSIRRFGQGQAAAGHQMAAQGLR